MFLLIGVQTFVIFVFSKAGYIGVKRFLHHGKLLMIFDITLWHFLNLKSV